MDFENYLRRPVEIDELLKIPQQILDNHCCYVACNTQQIDKETIFYLDDLIDVDDETDEEIYPLFSLEHDLEQFFFGQVMYDIITNTKYQIPNPTINDFIKNINYYNENDNFYTF